MDLVALMKTVEDNWPFDEANYPGYDEIPEGERMRFKLRHILDHQIKAAGRLAGVTELLDHGACLNEAELAHATRNFLINTLRLAAASELSPTELTSLVQQWAAEKHKP